MLRPVSTFQSCPTSRPCYGHSTGYQLLLAYVLKFWLWPTLQPTRQPLPTYIIQAYTPARPLCSAATGRLDLPASRATGSRSFRLWSFSTLAPQWWNDLPIRTVPSLPIVFIFQLSIVSLLVITCVCYDGIFATFIWLWKLFMFKLLKKN